MQKNKNFPLYLFSSILRMKSTNKRKTINYLTTSKQRPNNRRKHYSSVISLEEQGTRLIIDQVIEELLNVVFARQKEKDIFIRSVLKQFHRQQVFDDQYFHLQMGKNQEQIICKQDEQPHPQEEKSSDLGASQLKKINKKKLQQLLKDQIQHCKRSSYLDAQKKDRDVLIHKLKKQYSMILNTKYDSQSMPIGQSRSFFIENDSDEINQLRKNYSKINLVDLKKKKTSPIQQQLRRNHKLNTIFKRSKDFVETIDPTMSNSVYTSQVNQQKASRRNSISNMTSQMQQDERVLAKVTKFKQISNLIKTKQQQASDRSTVGISYPSNENNRFSNNSFEQDREALKNKIQRSFHSNSKGKFRQVDDLKFPRINNSISLSFLPKINKNLS